MSKSHPIGIDLGTTFSAVSKWRQSRNFTGSEVYNLYTEGRDSVPSKVYYETSNGSLNPIVGKIALQKIISNPDNGIWAVKRDMDNADEEYEVGDYVFSPIDVSAEILKMLLGSVEKVENPNSYLPKGIVVTVPHYFLNHQKKNTKDAALKALSDLYSSRIADPESLFLGLVAEPIAAGLDFAFANSDQNLNGERFLVFDLGGGTFDVTIFALEQTSDTIKFTVLGIDGNSRLGGEDFDESFARFIWDESGFDISALSEKDRRRVLKKALPVFTEAKEILSVSSSTSVILSPVTIDMSPIDMDAVDRRTFEQCLMGEQGNIERNLFSEIERKLDTVLNKAGIKAGDITSVLLTGGSSNIPLFQNLIGEKFGSSKVRTMKDVHLAVSRGAAVYAAYLLDERLQAKGEGAKYLDLWKKIEIVEPTPHAIAIPTKRSPFRVLIQDNVVTPTYREIPVVPSELSADGKEIIFEKLSVLEGTKEEYSEVGVISIDEKLYTHGRKREAVRGTIRLTVERNLIRVRIFLPKSKADGSDFVWEEDLSLEKKS